MSFTASRTAPSRPAAVLQPGGTFPRTLERSNSAPGPDLIPPQTSHTPFRHAGRPMSASASTTFRLLRLSQIKLVFL
jgi:hypothetical protein